MISTHLENVRQNWNLPQIEMNIQNICKHHLVLIVGYAMQFPTTPTPHLLHWYHTSITPTSLRSPRSAVKSWLKLRQWLHQDTYWLKPMIAYCLVFAGSVWLRVPSCLDVSQTLSTSNKPQYSSPISQNNMLFSLTWPASCMLMMMMMMMMMMISYTSLWFTGRNFREGIQGGTKHNSLAQTIPTGGYRIFWSDCHLLEWLRTYITYAYRGHTRSYRIIEISVLLTQNSLKHKKWCICEIPKPFFHIKNISTCSTHFFTTAPWQDAQGS